MNIDCVLKVSSNSIFRIQCVIPANPRDTKNKKRIDPKGFDKYIYKDEAPLKDSVAGLKAKKVSVRYEYPEISYMGLILLACAMIVWRVLDDLLLDF